MERVLNSKLLAYLEDNELLSDHQYGFRRGRSTGDLLVYVTHCWGEAIEKHFGALAVTLDILKGFDRVWHASLLGNSRIWCSCWPMQLAFRLLEW